ncbi:MAG TPA: CAP domain-containing protein [Acidimicrobiales bacterium]|nr:CAP domain-containing protein [Acidimicrobiales bacterium]
MLFTMMAALLLHSPGAAQAAAGDDEKGFLALVNQERAARGLGRLVAADDLVAVARRHSARMAARNEVFHNSNLSSEVEGWELLGENVGLGPTVREVHEALMASKVHRDVILHPRFTELGVGVVLAGGEMWVTEVFRLPEAPPESTVTTAAPAEAPPAGEAEPSAPPATASPPVAGTARPGDGEAAAAAPAPAPPAAPATASAAPARRPGPALRRLQVAGQRPAIPAIEEATPPAVPPPGPEEAPPAPPTAPLEPLVIDDINPQAISLPLPKPTDIPEAGLVAAGLLLLVVGSASVTTRRVVAG